MLGLLSAVVLFNAFAFFTNSRLTKSQILQIWTFTIAFQIFVDTYMNQKFHGYWYFDRGIDLKAIPALIVLIPPVNMIFLNRYPFGYPLLKRIMYVILWAIGITLYEWLAVLPEPWGYFRYGWWKITYSLLVNPLLLYIVVKFYELVRKFENES
ncbi:hypothetical protein M3N64_13085 [Sporolactobacillus sp. CPB3-1]|uniref:Uncharacterized protein n=2 Tax=Sporolactobacillus mangiferae TaxID=2940498 RepID=A0ABT0MD97_9BACL|nr:hypothetical protein [Sporolactobacillus mangiferae]MCL1632855.1 hypothetical protein [Sporolactobacillus mangiferae]